MQYFISLILLVTSAPNPFPFEMRGMGCHLDAFMTVGVFVHCRLIQGCFFDSYPLSQHPGLNYRRP